MEIRWGTGSYTKLGIYMFKKLLAALFALCFFLCAGCGKSDFYGAAAKGAGGVYDEVIIQVGGDRKPLEAVLTLPRGSGTAPVVVLVQGSGPSDRDETIGENKPFADIAHGLAQRGIASLRFDKRTFIYPEDFAEKPTIEAEVLDDAASAISIMKREKSVGDIFVLGHSQGGMLAPKIAQDNEDVKGIVIMAGSPRSLADIIYDQNMDVMDKTDVADVIKKVSKKQLQEEADKAKAAQPGDTQQYFGLPGEYWASLNAIDTSKIAQSLKIPMLVLQGGADFQVSVKNDFAAWEMLLGGRKNATLKLYDNLNHLFMESNGKKDSSEYDVKSSVSPEVISDIADFVKGNSK